MRWHPCVWGLAFLLAGCGDDGIEPAPTAALFVTPRKFVFAKLQPGERDEQRVRLENRGGGDLVVAAIETRFDRQFRLYWHRGDDAARQVVVVDAEGVNRFERATIGPGESMTLVLEFTPSGPNDGRAGSVSLETNDGRVVLPIEVDPAAPEIHVAPKTLDFGRVPAGQSKVLKSRLTNLGQYPLRVESVEVMGSPDFGAEVAAGTVVPPGGALDVQVAYAPPNEGPDTGVLRVRSDDPARPIHEIGLRGNAGAPCIRVSPARREFPPTTVGRTDTRAVTLESCGGEALTIREVRVEGEAFAVGDLPPLPAALPAVRPDAPAPARDVEVRYTPPDDGVHAGTLVIVSDDPATCDDAGDCRVEVPLLGRGTLNECPQPRVAQDEFDVRPLDVVDLDGTASFDVDGAIAAWRWVVVQRPDDSTQAPVERFRDPARPQDGGAPDDPDTPGAQFFVDLAGDYVLELRVTDDGGVTTPSASCDGAAAQVRIRARPDQAIHVQLVWRTPGDPDETDERGTDVDLHLFHPSARGWDTGPLDCHYQNPHPDWGGPGDANNPHLDLDDTDGAGPENINLDDPEDTAAHAGGYRVGVHYYGDTDFELGPLGPSDATLRVYLDGLLAWEETRRLQRTDDWWRAAEIRWTRGQGEVAPLP